MPDSVTPVWQPVQEGKTRAWRACGKDAVVAVVAATVWADRKNGHHVNRVKVIRVKVKRLRVGGMAPSGVREAGGCGRLSSRRQD